MRRNNPLGEENACIKQILTQVIENVQAILTSTKKKHHANERGKEKMHMRR